MKIKRFLAMNMREAIRLGYDDFGAVMPHMQHLDDDKIVADVDCAIGHLTAAGWGPPQSGLVGARGQECQAGERG